MPEFLTEKNWENDFIDCENWLIGIDDIHTHSKQTSYTRLFTLACQNKKLKHKSVSFEITKYCELVKYVRNVFLATKVSFCNEVYDLAQKHEIGWEIFSKMCFDDKRIGQSHCKVPGPDGKRGYGGTCFPKDVHSLQHQFCKLNIPSPILDAVISRNENIDRTEQDWYESKNRAVE
jgi:UDPglucose 6-dehydrogenase